MIRTARIQLLRCSRGSGVTTATKQQDNAPAPAAQPVYEVVKREKDRWWEVRDPRGELVCVTLYKRGAVEVVRRLAA
jgi:hypothetical protein